jgi:hypothetical protein
MAMTLQQAIDYAVAPPEPTPFGIQVYIAVTIHDDEGGVLVGSADGLDAMFRSDLPLLNWGTGTIAGGGGTATTGKSFFKKGPSPGFSSRGLGPGDGTYTGLAVVGNVYVGGNAPGTSIPIDFSVRKDPGITFLSFLGMGPRVQMEIETLSGPKPGGTPTYGVKLDPVEDGTLLRAVGRSLLDPGRRASYTATVSVSPRIG